MSFKKFFSLVFQLGFFTFKSIQLGIIFCSFCGDYFLYARFQQNSDFRWKLVCFIDFFNLFLYNIYQNSLCCAIFSPFIVQEESNDDYLIDLGKLLREDLQEKVDVCVYRVISRNANDLELDFDVNLLDK